MVVTALVASGGTLALVGAGVLIGAGAASTGVATYEAASGKEAFTGRELTDEEHCETVGSLVGGLAGAAAGGEIGGAIFDKPVAPTARGRVSEGRVLDDMGLPKNTEKVSAQEGNSIPDFVDDTKLGDVKDAKSVSNTRQLRIQRDVANKRGLDHVVVTGKTTNVRPTVTRAGTKIIRRPDLGPGARNGGRGIPAPPVTPQQRKAE